MTSSSNPNFSNLSPSSSLEGPLMDSPVHSPKEGVFMTQRPGTVDSNPLCSVSSTMNLVPQTGGISICAAVVPQHQQVSAFTTSVSSKPQKEVFIIGIAGGSASGKTSVSEMIIRNLNVPWVVLISMDSFYKVLTPEAIASANQNNYNFDHPDAFDYPILFDTLNRLKKGEPVEVPIYDFTTHSRRSETKLISGASVIIFEGILALYDKAVTSLMDMKIFVDTDSDVRLSRRLIRDIANRGRDLNGVLEQYNRFVKPSFDDFIQPTVRYADIIIPRGLDNIVAIDLITKHIARRLEEKKIAEQ